MNRHAAAPVRLAWGVSVKDDRVREHLAAQVSFGRHGGGDHARLGQLAVVCQLGQPAGALCLPGQIAAATVSALDPAIRASASAHQACLHAACFGCTPLTTAEGSHLCVQGSAPGKADQLEPNLEALQFRQLCSAQWLPAVAAHLQTCLESDLRGEHVPAFGAALQQCQSEPDAAALEATLLDVRTRLYFVVYQSVACLAHLA